jgi:hypothetical protein
LKEDRAFKVVIRYLHADTPVDEIKQDLEKNGFQVRNITNVIQKVKKKLKLPLKHRYLSSSWTSSLKTTAKTYSTLITL